MSERPTPETDKAKCKFTSLFGDDEDAYWVPLKVARRLERERDAERALADRLAGVFEHFAKIVGPPDSDHDSRWVTDDELDDLWQRTQSALAAWKEARGE